MCSFPRPGSAPAGARPSAGSRVARLWRRTLPSQPARRIAAAAPFLPARPLPGGDAPTPRTARAAGMWRPAPLPSPPLSREGDDATRSPESEHRRAAVLQSLRRTLPASAIETQRPARPSSVAGTVVAPWRARRAGAPYLPPGERPSRRRRRIDPAINTARNDGRRRRRRSGSRSDDTDAASTWRTLAVPAAAGGAAAAVRRPAGAGAERPPPLRHQPAATGRRTPPTDLPVPVGWFRRNPHCFPAPCQVTTAVEQSHSGRRSAAHALALPPRQMAARADATARTRQLIGPDRHHVAARSPRPPPSPAGPGHLSAEKRTQT